MSLLIKNAIIVNAEKMHRQVQDILIDKGVIAKKATVATNVMNTAVMASGRRTSARRIAHTIIGDAPDWNGVR